MNDDEDEGSTAIGTSPLMSRRERALFHGKIYVAGWIFVFHIVPWAWALMLSAFSAWAVNEELIEGRYWRCLEEGRTSQLCYFIVESS